MTRIIAGLALLAVGCEKEPAITRLCLAEDLGGYRFESVAATSEEPGCLARYRDARGKLVTARVTKKQRGGIPDGGVTFPFEKHLVIYRPEQNGVRVGWRSSGVEVELFLEGLAVPQGPVLRAYLFNYRSKVTSELAPAKQKLTELREENRSRPRSAAVHLDLARNYRRLGNNLMAIQEYHIAVDTDRSCYFGYLELGDLYFELRHWDLAIRALRRAAALRPQDPEPKLRLGDVFYQVQNRKQAGEAYRSALQLGVSGGGRERASCRLPELEKEETMTQLSP